MHYPGQRKRIKRSGVTFRKVHPGKPGNNKMPACLLLRRRFRGTFFRVSIYRHVNSKGQSLNEKSSSTA